MSLKKSFIFPLIFFITLITGTSPPDFSSACLVSAAESETPVSLIPSGQAIGVTLKSAGVLVVDVSEVISHEGKRLYPAKDAGLKSGDLIEIFNGNKIATVEDLNTAITASGGKKSSVTLNRSGNEVNILISPALSKADGNFKIGAWVKDAASGIGTMTFYNPKTKEFAAL